MYASGAQYTKTGTQTRRFKYYYRQKQTYTQTYAQTYIQHEHTHKFVQWLLSNWQNSYSYYAWCDMAPVAHC